MVDAKGRLLALARDRRVWATLAVLALIPAAVFTNRFYQRRKLANVRLDLTTLMSVERGKLEKKFQETGAVTPKGNIDIASLVSGRVTELFVREGQTVKAGQPLAVVQPGRTGAEKFMPSTLNAPVGGVLLRCMRDNGGGGTNVTPFVLREDYLTGRFDSAKDFTCLMTIVDMKKLVIKLQINEVDILKLSEGMSVNVTVDSLPGVEFPGTVTMLSRQAEESRGYNSGKVFQAEVSLDKVDEKLRIGMTARVLAVMEKREKVLKVSLGAVFEEDGRTSAFVHREGDRPKQVEVKLGFKTATEAEVLEGLKEGDKVFPEKPVDFEALPKAAAPSAPAIALAEK
ncbi:MAG: HlyD family efflux transporter periplasmic adaptor subunit [Elusimicrobia bacterium]|nr:HlyD family efflux transporter periplasmic adaptor subunit [Elusimicrobiota bacterium]